MKHTLLFPALACLLFGGLLSAATAAPESEAQSKEALLVTAAVFELFEGKCNDCHGAQLAKPKGKFGYMMDLKRVAANEEYVVPGEPDKSEMYRLVNEDEMPGKDSEHGIATAAEKLALRQWIQIGAPAALPAALAARQTELLSAHAPEPEKPKAGRTFVQRFTAWLGSFHAASTHFPIALLMVAVLSEALGWWTRKETWLTCTRFLLLLGAASAVNTATLGWLNVYSGISSVYKFHQWLGTGTAIWAVLTAGCAVLFECREDTPERARLRGALFLGAALVGLTGFLGGAIVYGLDYHNW
ncbi:MAG: hypothetical protein JHC85_15000 [Chthoniobacterales bacterium]|nr:hypothetical protein [Chthoniobacterales bacterium]